RYRREAVELIRRAEERIADAAPAGPDREPPRIELLWPHLTEAQRRDGLTLSVDRDQLGVLGIVSDDRALSQVTVGGVYPDWFPVTPQELTELRSAISQKGFIRSKGLIRSKR